MLDRLFKTIIVGTLLMFIVRSIIGLLCRILLSAFSGAVLRGSHAASTVGDILLAFGAVCLGAGLLVRTINWLQEGLGGRSRRSKAAARTEWAGRESAGEMPLHGSLERKGTGHAVGKSDGFE